MSAPRDGWVLEGEGAKYGRKCDLGEDSGEGLLDRGLRLRDA